MTRKQALAVITADAAENGLATKTGIRAYVENRVSAEAFHKAVQVGQQIHAKRQEGKGDFA